MVQRPEQRREGALIAEGLKRTRLSQRKAAERAGISEVRFRAIMHGYQTVAAGQYIAVKGPSDTVARIAQVLGITPEQLDEAERPDAAEDLRTLLRDQPGKATGVPQEPGEEDDGVLAAIETALDRLVAARQAELREQMRERDDALQAELEALRRRVADLEQNRDPD